MQPAYHDTDIAHLRAAFDLAQRAQAHGNQPFGAYWWMPRALIRTEQSMSDNSAPQAQSTPAWQGFHHIALVTPDLDATIHTEVLSMAVTGVLAASDRNGRHCFIKPGARDS